MRTHYLAIPRTEHDRIVSACNMYVMQDAPCLACDDHLDMDEEEEEEPVYCS